jgi:hypothetical protein
MMQHEIKFKDFELKVMTKLLEGDDPVLLALRKQYAKAIVEKRKFTGVGFYSDFYFKEQIEPVEICKNFTFGDVTGTINDIVIDFVLFIRNGKIAMLEGFSFGVPWPEHIYTLELEYWDGEKRNLERLRNNWTNNF